MYGKKIFYLYDVRCVFMEDELFHMTNSDSYRDFLGGMKNGKS